MTESLEVTLTAPLLLDGESLFLALAGMTARWDIPGEGCLLAVAFGFGLALRLILRTLHVCRDLLEDQLAVIQQGTLVHAESRWLLLAGKSNPVIQNRFEMGVDEIGKSHALSWMGEAALPDGTR